MHYTARYTRYRNRQSDISRKLPQRAEADEAGGQRTQTSVIVAHIMHVGHKGRTSPISGVKKSTGHAASSAGNSILKEANAAFAARICMCIYEKHCYQAMQCNAEQAEGSLSTFLRVTRTQQFIQHGSSTRNAMGAK